MAMFLPTSRDREGAVLFDLHAQKDHSLTVAARWDRSHEKNTQPIDWVHWFVFFD